jgi:hypothetical protein
MSKRSIEDLQSTSIKQAKSAESQRVHSVAQHYASRKNTSREERQVIIIMLL